MAKAVVNVHAAKTQFSKLLERAESGEEVVIARGGKPVARLAPLRSARPKSREPGLLAGRVHIASDFHAPLSDEDSAALGDPAIEPPRRSARRRK